ncbi:MAG: hypothetical protein AMS21_01885 [Gemmatimonas sp. SG8_38_2]|nr:MAG: hypothetical protein AMS21_01885 [Gemmatimonas sp. SG8_38_2]
MTRSKAPSRKSNPAVGTGNRPVPTVGTHEVERGHGSRVDELSAERATHQAKAKPWDRGTALDAPPPREGMVQRWIRRTVRGEDDPMNLNKAFRIGWAPRPAETIPDEWKMFCTKSSSGDGVFAVNDLILCELPEEIFEEIKADEQERRRLQMYSVEVDLENSQIAGGPPIVRDHRTAVTHPARTVGRRVEVADNE